MRQTVSEEKTHPLVAIGTAMMAAGKRLYRFFSVEPVKSVSRIGITGLFVVLVNKGVGKGDVASLVNSLAALPLTLACLLGALSIFLQILRWRIVLRMHGLPCSAAVAAGTMFRGFLFAFVTPGRLGELFRAVDLSPGRRKETVVAVFEERFFGIAATVLVGAAALAVEVLLLRRQPFYPLAVASVLFVLVVTLAVAGVAGRKTIPRTIDKEGKVAAALEAVRRRIVSYPYGALAGLSAGAQLCLVAETVVLLSMFGAPGWMHTAVAAAEAYSFMLLLPFFIANIGLREYAFAFFIVRATANPLLLTSTSAVALGGATAVLILNIMLPAAIGLVWVFIGKRTAPAAADGTFTSDNREPGNVASERNR